MTTIERMLEAMFSFGSAPRPPAELQSVVSSSVEWSDVKYLVGEWESSVVSWKSVCEEKTRRLVWNGRQIGTQLVELTVDKSSAQQLWQEELSAGRWRISLGRSRFQETASGDCNRLRTLVCVCQWSVKCSSEWCTYVVNKSNIQSIPRL
jgi:hypothetical protein